MRLTEEGKDALPLGGYPSSKDGEIYAPFQVKKFRILIG